MHVLGKVLTGFVIIGALAALGLTAKMLDVRGSWLKKASELKEENIANAAKIDELEAKLRAKRSELARVQIGWGQSWNLPQPPTVNPSGLVAAPIGTNQGVRAPDENNPAPVLYLFRPDQQTGMKYVGPFKAQTVRDNQLGMMPTWTTRPDEVTGWQSGGAGTWRIRSMVPSFAVSRFADLYADLTTSDETLSAKQENLARHNQLLAEAEAQQKVRQQELLGGIDVPPATELPPEFTEGLVKAVEDEEEARNKLLAQVDQLRRELQQKRARLLTLVEGNRNLTTSPASTLQTTPVNAGNAPSDP